MIDQTEINNIVNRFDISSYLSAKGIKFAHSAKGITLCSPFREEREPSAVIYNNSKLYHDSGDGTKLALTKFVMELERCSFQNAINIMRDGKFQELAKTVQQEYRESKAAKYEFSALQNSILLQYCYQRGISAQTAKKYCGECLKDNKYFYISFANDKGGHVLRNGTSSRYAKINEQGKPSTISTINNQSDRVVILEGFFDFLSLVEFWKLKTAKALPYNAIVLNSCENLTANIIDSLSNYNKIYTLLDSDKKGIATTKKISDAYPIETENLTAKFLNESCNDFNDFWVNYKKTH